jgi:iron complex transport system permease protein
VIRAAILVGVAVVLAIGVGSSDVTALQAWAALFGAGDADAQLAVWTYRMPRVALAGLVGASLGVAGAALQGLFQNDLADPYVLGVSAGGALGAAIAIALGWAGWAGPPSLAFLGAGATLAAVYALGRTTQGLSLPAVLLGGVAIGLTCSAGITVVLLLADTRRADVLLWLMGHLGGAQWREVAVVGGTLLAGWVLIRRHAASLDVLLGGELCAAALGVPVKQVKRDVLLASAVLVAGAVAFCGLIGFVGLVVPHVIRFRLGPGHHALLRLSVLGGAGTLILADAIARSFGEWPVGVLTGLVGGPFFLYLLRRQARHAAR